MKPWAIAAVVIAFAAGRSSSQLEHGRYRGTLTTSSGRELAGGATYTRCGNLLHLWLADTVSRGVAMEFGTSVPSLQPRTLHVQPIDLLYPPRSRVLGTGGFFRLYVPPDTLLFADSGTMRLIGLDRGEITGEFRYTVSETWAGKPELVASVTGTFRALRDSVHEHRVYRGARCDHPGAEWPGRGRD